MASNECVVSVNSNEDQMEFSFFFALFHTSDYTLEIMNALQDNVVLFIILHKIFQQSLNWVSPYLCGSCGNKLWLVVDPSIRTRFRLVFLAEVEAWQGTVNPAWAKRTIHLAGNPKGQHLRIGVPAALIIFCCTLERATVGRYGWDEVVQEKVEWKDGTGKTQDEQDQELELGEATNIIQDLLKPHGDEMERLRTEFRVQMKILFSACLLVFCVSLPALLN